MDLADVGRQIEQRLQERRLTVPVLPSVAAMVLTVGHAIARLGMRTVGDVVFAACIGPRLFPVPLYAARIQRIWQESLATALWAYEINLLREQKVNGNFLCGLLHQVGLPVVLQAVQDILGPAPQPAPSEEDIEGLLHCFGARAGLDVATRWRLPEPVVAVIGYLHDPAAAPCHGALVAGVAAARVLAVATLDGAAWDSTRFATLAPFVAAGLDEARLDRLAAQQPSVQDILSQG